MTEAKKELIDKHSTVVERFNMGLFELTNWEMEFLDSIVTQLEAEDGFLTDPQIESLEKIYNKYCEEE